MYLTCKYIGSCVLVLKGLEGNSPKRLTIYTILKSINKQILLIFKANFASLILKIIVFFQKLNLKKVYMSYTYPTYVCKCN